MERLKERYEKVIVDRDKWSYYNCPPKLEYDTILNKDESYEFILQYFHCGGKQALFNDPYIEKNKEIIKRRAPHIVSTYLLGIIIAKSLECDLSIECSDGINFKYLWFLACLYHDIGYIYEENHCCEFLRDIQINGLDAIKRICDIKYSIDRFTPYTKEDIDIYLSHRAKCENGKAGVIDHGIAGGLMLYDRLRKNYDQAWEQVSMDNQQMTKRSFRHNELLFSNSHYKYYAIAAEAVIAHNIWVSTLNEVLKEEDKHPTKILPKIDRSNQIAFILALADTIEPVKRYGIFALDMIYYEDESIENGFKLRMPYCSNSDTYNYITDLTTWLNINVKREDNTFLITKIGEATCHNFTQKQVMKTR